MTQQQRLTISPLLISLFMLLKVLLQTDPVLAQVRYSEAEAVLKLTQIINYQAEDAKKEGTTDESIWPGFDLSQHPIIVTLPNGKLIAFNLWTVDRRWREYKINGGRLEVQGIPVYFYEKPEGQSERRFFKRAVAEVFPPMDPRGNSERMREFSDAALFIFYHEQVHKHQFRNFEIAPGRRRRRAIAAGIEASWEPSNYRDYQNPEVLRLNRFEAHLALEYLRFGEEEVLWDLLAVDQERNKLMSSGTLKREDDKQVMEGAAHFTTLSFFQEYPLLTDFNPALFWQDEAYDELDLFDFAKAIQKAGEAHHHLFGSALAFGLHWLEVEGWKEACRSEANASLRSIIYKQKQWQDDFRGSGLNERAYRLAQVELEYDEDGNLLEQAKTAIAPYKETVTQIEEAYAQQEGIEIKLIIEDPSYPRGLRYNPGSVTVDLKREGGVEEVKLPFMFSVAGRGRYHAMIETGRLGSNTGLSVEFNNTPQLFMGGGKLGSPRYYTFKIPRDTNFKFSDGDIVESGSVEKLVERVNKINEEDERTGTISLGGEGSIIQLNAPRVRLSTHEEERDDLAIEVLLPEYAVLETRNLSGEEVESWLKSRFPEPEGTPEKNSIIKLLMKEFKKVKLPRPIAENSQFLLLARGRELNIALTHPPSDKLPPEVELSVFEESREYADLADHVEKLVEFARALVVNGSIYTADFSKVIHGSRGISPGERTHLWSVHLQLP